MNTFQCNTCGSQGSSTWMLSHNCAHNAYVRESGGRCEDFPCCGHTDGDGCYALESHTSEYWARDPHLLCDHNTGHCEVDSYDDDVDPELCSHDADYDDIDANAGTLTCHTCGSDGVMFPMMGQTIVLIGEERIVRPDAWLLTV